MATWDEKLATVLEPLEEHGFPVDLWDTEYIMDGRILINKFVKAVRVLKKKIVTEGVLEKLLEKGGSENYWETQGTCTPRQLYEFCHWLQEKEGTDFIFRARRACKLEEKLLADETPTDTAFVGALGYQIQEYDDLKRGTRVDLAKLKTEMVPGSAYKEMNRSVFEEACWDSFTKMIIVETVVPPEFSAENVQSSLKNFGDIVRTYHRIEFMKREDRREEMILYIRRKLLEHGAAGNFEMMNLFASYLEAVGQEVDENILAVINTTTKSKLQPAPQV